MGRSSHLGSQYHLAEQLQYFNQILKSERLVFILKQDEQRKQTFTMKIYFLDENEQLRFAQHRIPWIISG